VEQNEQPLVQTSPNIIKVAVLFLKHSPIFGHLAVWHTVCKFLSLKFFLSKSRSDKDIFFFSIINQNGAIPQASLPEIPFSSLFNV